MRSLRFLARPNQIMYDFISMDRGQQKKMIVKSGKLPAPASRAYYSTSPGDNLKARVVVLQERIRDLGSAVIVGEKSIRFVELDTTYDLPEIAKGEDGFAPVLGQNKVFPSLSQEPHILNIGKVENAMESDNKVIAFGWLLGGLIFGTTAVIGAFDSQISIANPILDKAAEVGIAVISFGAVLLGTSLLRKPDSLRVLEAEQHLAALGALVSQAEEANSRKS